VNNFSQPVKKILRKYGCFFERHGKGDHEIWYSPISEIRFPVDSKIKSRHTANGILKQAGIIKKF
jgi:predicted RNA binding protein YcfA (HicA-like mRNA interferase family)